LADFAVQPDPIRQFNAEAPVDTVLAVYRVSDGADLAGTAELFEQTPISLIVSAGPLPSVEHLPLDVAQTLIEAAGLKLGDTSAREYSDTVAADAVIRLVPTTDPIRVGDVVGLVLS